MLERRNRQDSGELEEAVSGIIRAVKKQGDTALVDFCEKFDGCKLQPSELKISEQEIRQAYNEVDDDFLQAIKNAKKNIESYHQKQLHNSWIDLARDGVMLGQLVRPLQRVGIYVPGGKASYPSSVLMNAIPAKVAGVKEIAMVTPPGMDGGVDPHTLVVAAEAGVTEIYRIGGAQAVAALAYGTESIKRVDKITGPGNRYVTMAKRLVFGVVDIDMLAGPSEILIIADSEANPAYVAADLLSQAEHDEMAAVILITPDRNLADLVNVEIGSQLLSLKKKDIARKAIDNYGAIIITASIEEAIDLSNEFAPEHLELMLGDPFSYLNRIKSAGAIFIGSYTPEPVGDYMAGPNHVLPTGGTARFSSPLGVDQFVRRTSLLYYSHNALSRESADILKLAEMEGLDAHARSVSIRFDKDKDQNIGLASEQNSNRGGIEKQ